MEIPLGVECRYWSSRGCGAERGSRLGPTAGGVVGTFKIPLLLGLYSDTPSIPSSDVGAALGVSLTRAVVQQEFFDGPNSRFGTITEFYSDLSGGRVTLLGDTHDWFQASLSADDVAGTSNGLASADDVGEFIIELLANADAGGVDWASTITTDRMVRPTPATTTASWTFSP